MSEPTKDTHVMVGTFRPTKDQMARWISKACAEGPHSVVCPSGHYSQTVDGIWQCYSRGCFDEPVYVTIEEALKMREKS